MTSKKYLDLTVSIACFVGLAGLIAPSEAFAQSTVTSSTPGDPVDPAIYDVFLDTGDPLNVSVTVTVPDTPSKLDLFLNLDLSGSFFDDLPVLRNSVAPALISQICAPLDALCGVSSFIDKPIAPFGSRSDFVYNTDLALTSDTVAFQNTVNGLSIGNGINLPEAQLESLLQIAVRADDIGFREDALSVVVLTTDARFNRAGDGAVAGIFTPNDGDADLEIGANGRPGTGEDYPSIEQTRAALMDAGIVPIFAVTSGVTSTYQNLVDDFGFGTVVELESDSSNLVDAVLAGLENVLSDITLVAMDDDFGYVNSIVPTSFSDVPTGESRTFDVTLLSDGTGSDDTLSLVAPGFGETVVNVDVAVDVPEPTSILGLFAVGALGAGSTLKRKHKQKA